MRTKRFIALLTLGLALTLALPAVALADTLYLPLVLEGQVPPVAGVTYVKHDATGANDGSSWADAYSNL